MKAFEELDPQQVVLPNGTKVTARVDLSHGEHRVPSGAVGQVVGHAGDRVDVRLADGSVVRYLRADLVPTKLGQLRYAVRRERAWRALADCVVVRTVVGSRAWGLADPSSDTDVRGVFVLPFPWTTSLVEPPTELVSVDGSDTFWELDKTIRQAMRADPNTLETLFLEGATATDDMGRWLLEARDAFVSREIYGSFGRYALSQLKRLRQSKRLAENRATLMGWLREEPSLELDAAAARLATEAAVEGPSARDRVHRAKAYIKQLYVSLYDQGLLDARDYAAFKRFAQRGEREMHLPRKLRPKNAYNLIRLIDTATGWLSTGSPTFEVTEPLRGQLLAIKHGEVDLGEVMTIATNMMPALDAAREASPLPARANAAAVDALLRKIRHEAARRHFANVGGPFGADAAPMPPPEESS